MLSIFVWLLNQTPPDRKEILCDVHLKSDIASPVDMGHMVFLNFFNQHLQVGFCSWNSRVNVQTIASERFRNAMIFFAGKKKKSTGGLNIYPPEN